MDEWMDGNLSSTDTCPSVTNTEWIPLHLYNNLICSSCLPRPSLLFLNLLFIMNGKAKSEEQLRHVAIMFQFDLSRHFICWTRVDITESHFLKIQMLMTATLGKAKRRRVALIFVIGCRESALAASSVGVLMSLMCAFTPTMWIALPCQYNVNREEWIELLWH